MPKYTQQSGQPDTPAPIPIRATPLGSGYSVVPEPAQHGVKSKLRADSDAYSRALLKKAPK